MPRGVIGRWSTKPSGSKPRTCWTPAGAASANARTATASNPSFAQLTALARPHTPAKAKTQPTKNPPQQANKTTKKPPRRPHTQQTNPGHSMTRVRIKRLWR